jgi:integrase
VRLLFVDLGAKAGVPNPHPHRFRHTSAIQYLRNGGNIYTLKQMLGHSTFEMAERYLKLSEADMQQAARQHSTVSNWGLGFFLDRTMGKTGQGARLGLG